MMLRALGARCAARPPAQHVARRVSALADDGHGAGERRFVLTLLAVEPKPRRRPVQVAERRSRSGLALHGAAFDVRRAHQVQPLGLVADAETSDTSPLLFRKPMPPARTNSTAALQEGTVRV